jgi:hypothetical protein
MNLVKGTAEPGMVIVSKKTFKTKKDNAMPLEIH